MNILITGGSGFIGRAASQYFIDKAYNVTVLSRDKNKVSTASRVLEDLAEIDNNTIIDCIINLAGAPIDKRWTPAYKKTLVASRVTTTSNIISLINRLTTKPKLLISASAIGYYGAQDSAKLLNETSPFSAGFTHDLCQSWEATARQASSHGVRTCITRLGVVLGKNGGALAKMLPIFKLGLGGKSGSGQQIFSWVHITDVIRAFEFFMEHKTANGVYNMTSPNPVSNALFTTTLSKQLKRPALLTMPAFMLKILFGEMGEELLLKGQRVIPKRLQEADFHFKFSDLAGALQNILQ